MWKLDTQNYFPRFWVRVSIDLISFFFPIKIFAAFLFFLFNCLPAFCRWFCRNRSRRGRIRCRVVQRASVHLHPTSSCWTVQRTGLMISKKSLLILELLGRRVGQMMLQCWRSKSIRYFESGTLSLVLHPQPLHY